MASLQEMLAADECRKRFRAPVTIDAQRATAPLWCSEPLGVPESWMVFRQAFANRSTGINRRNQPIEPVASIPTTTGGHWVAAYAECDDYAGAPVPITTVTRIFS